MPVKFDDISKTATSLLNDDYQTNGYQMKSKQKTSWDGAVLTTTVDLFGKDSVQTPAKLSWKFPKPLGIAGFSVEKLELDKAGKFKLETSMDKALHTVPDLKIEAKSDLVDASKIVAGCTYTGIKDTQIIFETKATNPQDFVLDVTRTQGPATSGAKFIGVAKPDVGVRVASFPVFGSLTAKQALSVFNVTGHYQAQDNLKFAAAYEHGGKKSGTASVGVAFTLVKGTNLKAKVEQDTAVSVTVKHEISKGFSFLAGGKVAADRSYTYGLQLSIE